MRFTPLTEENLEQLKPFFREQTTRMSVYAGAYQFIWNRDLYSPDYAIVGRCLVLKGERGGQYYFYYPISRGGNLDEEREALTEIEKYCADNNYKLHFFNVPEERLDLLCRRYRTPIVIRSYPGWDDYLYSAEVFKNFEGKKFSGQRNHINKFYRNYPDAAFHSFQSGDEAKILAFLDEFEKTQFNKNDKFARHELKMVKKLVPHLTGLDQKAGYMEADGKIISFAAGEICGDTLVEHIEKALREYDGVYTATAQAFVKAFAGEGVVFLNREDDGGDLGLRKSKLQYNPCRMVRKFFIDVEKPLSVLSVVPSFTSERLKFGKITEKDAAAYFALASDIERNRYWGYDYREELNGEIADEKYFLNITRHDFRLRNELALGIFLGKKLVGEVVLWHFTYTGEAEIGVRILAEYEGLGYAREALRAACNYAFCALSVLRVEAKCYKENERSKKALEGAGMRRYGEDEIYYYFYRNPMT